MRLEEFSAVIEKLAPLTLQEDWDNSGFQIKLGNPQVTKVLTALEISDAVISEAAAQKAEVILTHHPMFFHSLKNVNIDSAIGNQLIRLIKEGISVYASHTPFDKCRGGNNDYLGELLHLRQLQLMEQDTGGFCRYGYTDGVYTASEYVKQIGSWLKTDTAFFRFIGDPAAMIKKVGLCTGAGAEFIKEAKDADCDLFVTGDVKYHDARLAQDLNINVLDLGHYGSEKIFAANMAEYLRKNTGIEILETQAELNPFMIL